MPADRAIRTSEGDDVAGFGGISRWAPPSESQYQRSGATSTGSAGTERFRAGLRIRLDVPVRLESSDLPNGYGELTVNLGEALREGTVTLRSHRIGVPDLTARILLAHALERDQSWLAAHSDEVIAEDRRQAYVEMIRARCSGVPTQYIRGYQEFFELAIHVTPDVLIPRPETEHLVEAAIGCVRPGDRVADIGTGSGAIAIAVARNSPGAIICASDVCSRALRVATDNATRLGSLVQFCQGDLGAPFRPGSLDLVVSNPPYVPRKDMGSLQRELRHEPSIALFGGDDGLRVVERLVHDVPRILKPGGWFLAEIGFNSRGPIEAMLERPEWERPEFWKDLAGIDRVVAVRRSRRPHHGPP